jgi:hypothetical protein
MIRIQLTQPNGGKRDVYVSDGGSLEVNEASVSQQWHGVHASVRVNGGPWFEVRETMEQIAAQVPAAS